MPGDRIFMRLTCPNCGARYEVDDAMIPPEGRDVQCSECATTWFQPGQPPASPPATGPLPKTTRTPTEQASVETTPEPTPEPEHVADTAGNPRPRDFGEDAGRDAAIGERQRDGLQPDPEPRPDPEVPSETRIPASAEVATRVVPPNDIPEESRPEQEASEDGSPRRSMDPAIRDILREEAEREARLRREEAGPVETQGEMPLDERPQDEHPLTQSRRARRRSDLEDAEDIFAAGVAKASQGSASRRDLLPDIEEINSTLRASEAAQPRDVQLDEAPRRISSRGRGVRIGFILTLLVAASAFYVYANVDAVAARVPQFAPELSAYRDMIDDLRFRLDDLARQLVEPGEPSAE